MYNYIYKYVWVDLCMVLTQLNVRAEFKMDIFIACIPI